MTATDVVRDDEHARRLRSDLIDELVHGGHLSASWQPIFARVPRHHFTPRLFIGGEDGRYRALDEQIDSEAWLSHAYADELCVTQLNADGTAWDTAVRCGTVEGLQTCTSSQPSLMTWMLERLDVQTGHRVLEIGTGTGYNAALLCERLGADNVTTVDVDPGLVDEARDRLAALGHHPEVVAVDGRDGCPAGAPYDRIIVTCSVPALPRAWVEQLRPGGCVIVNLGGLLGGGMLLAEKAGDEVVGRFLSHWATFLPARPGAPGVGEITPEDVDEGAYDIGSTPVSPDVLGDPCFAFLAWLATQDARPYGATSERGQELSCLIGTDGSWAEVYPPDDKGVRVVEQGGPRRLWKLVEDAHGLWTGAGRPDWSRFGFTAASGQQCAWLDSPDSGHAWAL